MIDDEDEILEIATDLAMRMLLEEPKFVVELEKRVEEKLDEAQLRPSTSKSKFNQKTGRKLNSEVLIEFEELEAAIQELAIIFRMVSRDFEENFEYLEKWQKLSLQRLPSNREAGILFEIGLKVERICGMEKNSLKAEIINQICCVCRRIGRILKDFDRKIRTEIHVGSCYSQAAKICDVSYTITHQIERLQVGSRREKMIKNLVNEIDQFNSTVVEKLEKTIAKLNAKEQREERKKKLASSIQEGIREMSRDVMNQHRYRFHQPGSIAENIVTRHRGYLISDSLYRARCRVPTTSFEKLKKRRESTKDRLEVQESEETPEDEYVMKTAAVISREIIGELKNCLKIGNDQSLYLGLKP